MFSFRKKKKEEEEDHHHHLRIISYEVRFMCLFEEGSKFSGGIIVVLV